MMDDKDLGTDVNEDDMMVGSVVQEEQKDGLTQAAR